jgi:hypothetical protein
LIVIEKGVKISEDFFAEFLMSLLKLILNLVLLINQLIHPGLETLPEVIINEFDPAFHG